MSLWLCLLSTPSLAQFEFTWDGASGLTPDEIRLPYRLFLSGGAPAPVLDSGILTIATATNADNAYYLQTAPVVNTGEAFVLEFKVRLVSGSASSSARAPITIFFTVADAQGTLLLIDADKVFFLNASGTQGTIAEVDTDDAPHVYRVEHDGAGGFTLSYDGAETLTTSVFTDAASHGSQMRIGWGEGSNFATGTSEWYYVKHDAIDQLFRDSLESTE